MICIGAGPGPKNVLAQHPDGTQIVYPYAIWKHKVSKGIIPTPPKWAQQGES